MMEWASAQEADDEHRKRTIPSYEGISIMEAIELSRKAQQENEQAQDVQLEIEGE